MNVFAKLALDRSEDDRRLNKLYRTLKQRARGEHNLESSLDKIRGKGRQVSRDYLASMIIGGAATPLALLGGSRIARGLHNRDVRKAIAATRSSAAKKALRAELQTGPIVGRSYGHKSPAMKPLTTTSELAGQGVRGAVMGSIIQMLRDRFSGSAGLGN